MKILHCIEKEAWEKMKEEKYPGKELLEKNPFIHCSSIEYFWRVSPHFDQDKKERVLPYLRAEDGSWIKNPELSGIENK